MTGLSDTPAGDVLTDRGTEDTKVGRTYQFDASTKPQKAALQELGGLWGGGATLLSPRNGKRPFRLKGQQDLLGDMSVVQFEATPLVATRPGPGRDYHAGTLSVTVTLKGSVQLVVGGNSFRLRPGDAAIYHPKYLYHLNILEPSQQIRATIPYGVAGDSILDRIVVEKVAGHTPQAQLLTSQLKTLCEALSKRQRANALHLSRGLGGFLTGILEPEPALETRMDPHFFKRLAILNFVEDNLTSGTLTPSFLADRFAVSRATLYRIFQDLGVWEAIAVRSGKYRKIQLSDENFSGVVKFSRQDLNTEFLGFSGQHQVVLETLQAAQLELQALEIGGHSQLRLMALDLVMLGERDVRLVLELQPDCTHFTLVGASGPFRFDRLAAIREFPEPTLSEEQTVSALEEGVGAEQISIHQDSYLALSELDLRVLVAEVREVLQQDIQGSTRWFALFHQPFSQAAANG